MSMACSFQLCTMQWLSTSCEPYAPRLSYLSPLYTLHVASPPDIGTLEAGGKTNVKSGKVKFFLFSLYSTFS